MQLPILMAGTTTAQRAVPQETQKTLKPDWCVGNGRGHARMRSEVGGRTPPKVTCADFRQLGFAFPTQPQYTAAHELRHPDHRWHRFLAANARHRRGRDHCRDGGAERIEVDARNRNTLALGLLPRPSY
jgi:hypothetical protein